MFLRFINDLFMIWTGSEQDLLDFMNDLNKKHPLIKFEFKYSQTKIKFPNVLVYKDQNNMLQTTIQRKQTEQQNHLDAQSEHSKSLKDSIPYSQALWIKPLCFSQQEFLKLVSTIFYQIFIFSPNDSPSKTMKNIFLLHLKSSFRSPDIQIFVIFSIPFHTF